MLYILNKLTDFDSIISQLPRTDDRLWKSNQFPSPGNTTPPPQPQWASQSSYNSLKQVQCLQPPADIFPLTVHHHTGLGATPEQNTTLPPQPHWAFQSSYNSLKQVQCLQSLAYILPLTVHHHSGLGASPGQEIPHSLLNLTELTRAAIIPSSKLSVSSLQLISSHWQVTTTKGLVPPQGRKYPNPSPTPQSLPEQP